MTGRLDVLKETDVRVGFTQHFTGTGIRSALDDETLQRRLRLCLFGLGSNAGLKRVCATPPGEQYHDLLSVRRQYLHPDALRNAIAEVVNAIFRIRASHIWGAGTTACASDAKQFWAWDQTLLTEWHRRYGGRGVMIYWHVEKHATGMYSQLKTCSSSEVAVMLEGLLRHGTEMEVEKNYVDSGGQSEVGFAFCHRLGVHLLPRLQGIHRQKLYRPIAGHPDASPHLQTILERPIRWDLIRQQYDQMIKYATALRLGTAEADTLLQRFTRSQLQHPTSRAIIELGKAIQTVFLCQYLHEDALRRESNDGLPVVENWKSAHDFIFFGKGGEIATNRFEDQELALLSLHLLPISLVYINTLMMQQVLADQAWLDRMTPDDGRAFTPLIYAHINPYGTFELDMQKRLYLEAAYKLLIHKAIQRYLSAGDSVVLTGPTWGFYFKRPGLCRTISTRPSASPGWSRSGRPFYGRATRRQGLILCEDEASLAPWGSLSDPWARRGRQPEVPTGGKRKGYKAFGAIDYCSGRLFSQGIEGRFHAESYQAFLQMIMAQTTQHLFLIHDGAR